MNYGKSSKITKSIKSCRFPKLTETELWHGTLCAFATFLLGICPLPMSVYPLGIAFFCAASDSAMFAFAGLIAASFFTELHPLFYLLAVLFALLIRILVKTFIEASPATEKNSRGGLVLEGLFSEALSLRVTCAAVSAFTLSLFKIISGGFRYYDLFGAILAIGASTLGTLVFHGAFSKTNKKGMALYSKAARLAVSALICLSLSYLPLRGFEPALTAAFILILSFCLSDGLPEALICALLCGAVCGIEDVGALVISAFTAYCVLDISPVLASAVACIAGSICGVLISGSTYMTAPFLSLLFGCTLYSTQKKLMSNRISSKSANIHSKSDVTSAVNLKMIKNMISSAESAFHGLSSKFPQMGCAEKLLSSIKKEAEIETAENQALANALSHRLYELGFGKTTITAIGKRRLTMIIRGDRLNSNSERAELIKRHAEEIVGCPLSRPVFSDDGKTLTLCREVEISYLASLSQASKEGLCGDTAEVFFDSERSYLYAVICDGMGSGKAANSVSSRAVGIIKSLLLGGLEIENASTELVKFLPQTKKPSEEISTTMDLMRIDMYTGNGIIIKNGAAPSYIKRGGEILRLSANTVPLGILSINDSEIINFSVKSNDVVVMTSDGVSECEEDSRPICEYLNTHSSSVPADMAKDIIEFAKKNGKTDDLSAIVIKIFPKDF